MTITAILIAASINGAVLQKGTMVFAGYAGDNWELFALPAGETAPRKLTATPLDERAPALSPDGSRVAYATSEGALWVMELAAAETRRLDLPAGTYGYPAWLADGTGIVYTSYEYDPPHEDADLFIYDFATGRARPFLTQTGPQDYAALSPPGTGIAYISSLATSLPGFGSTITQQLWTVSLPTGEPSLLYGNARTTAPAWSPDGKSIAFSSDLTGVPQIWLLTNGARAPTQMTTTATAKTSPVWSRDGKEIAYVSTAAEMSVVEIVDVRTKAVRTVNIVPSAGITLIRDLDWSITTR